MTFLLKNDGVFLFDWQIKFNFLCLSVKMLLTVANRAPLPAPPSPHPSLSPRQPLIYFLFPWICFLWKSQRNGIIQYVVLCDWLLSLSIIMFSSSSMLSYSPVLHFFLLLSAILLYGYTFYLFCSSLNSCLLLEVFPYDVNSDSTCSLSNKTVPQSTKD